MLKPKTKWKLAEQRADEAGKLAEEVGCSPLVAQLLINRNINRKELAIRFLNSDESSFHDPFKMKGMKSLIERVQLAVQNQEKILVFGDYDADGVSSTAVMMTALKDLGADVDYYIPNRFTEGYGPNVPALKKAKDAGVTLVITVDTGISAIEEAAEAKEIGLDFIITDHHQPPPVLPQAYTIVNPHQPGCLYPFKGLSGAGIALKVAHAIVGKVPEELLAFAVLGTVADLVPLIEENRLLVVRGLKALANSKRPGIQALLKVSGVKGRNVTAEDVGFALGPRLNAAGRLDCADPAVELLLADDLEDAGELAVKVDELNQERKALVNNIADQAIEEVELYYPPDDNHVLVIAKEGWNPGVIGIVASRLVERFTRPAIVLGIERETGLAKGSARSIEGFDMYEHLSSCRDLMQAFGGHPMAAGMTIAADHLDSLRKKLNEQAEIVMNKEDFARVTHVDLHCRIEDISLERIEEFGRLAPFGTDNPVPKILIENASIREMKKLGSERNHLKTILSESERDLECIGFRFGHLYEEISSKAELSVVGELQINEWNGFRKPQLILKDVAVHHWQLFDLRNERDMARKLASLPEEKRLFIAFRSRTKEWAVKTDWADPFICLEEEEMPKVDFKSCYIVLLDLPYEEQQIKTFFSNCPVPERIYTVFRHEDKHFFSTIPSRDHFKWFYAFLLKKGTFDLKEHGSRLAQTKGWSKDTILFMAEVFSELGFISNVDGKLFLSESPAKKDLTESVAYREKNRFAKLENDLLFASFSSLHQWFGQFMQETQTFEGAVN